MTRTELHEALIEVKGDKKSLLKIDHYKKLSSYMKRVLCDRYPIKYEGLGYVWLKMNTKELMQYLKSSTYEPTMPDTFTRVLSR